MKIHGKKRLLVAAGTLTTLGAVATLVAGVTFGLFSATSPAQTDKFTAGTVSLTQPADVTCTLTNIVPGDSNAAQCTFSVQYTGSAPAYLGLDVSLAGTAAPAPTVAPYGGAAPAAAPGLYDGSATGLQLSISDGTTTFVNGTNANGGAFSPVGANPALTSLLVSNTPDATGTTHSFTVGFSMPQLAGNAYQGAATTVTMVVHAVQSGNNSAGACTAGDQCPAVAWS